MTLNAQFDSACAAFDMNVMDGFTSLIATLDAVAKEMAQSQEAREQLGANDPTPWPSLRKLWRDLAHAQLMYWGGRYSEEVKVDGDQNKEQSLTTMCVSLAKFTRNVVAGVQENQNHAYENEPDIRRLLHYHTSWTAMQDEKSFIVTRALSQALSNLVTANEPLMTRLWEIHMNLSENQAVLIRLLSSLDAPTLLAALVLILNCIHGSKERAKMLISTTVGVRVCISLLDNMANLYEADDSSDGAQVFDVGYNVFTRVIEYGLIPDLYNKLSMNDEIITPHQTTLLKLMDAYLRSTATVVTPAVRTKMMIHVELSPMLSSCFFLLSAYAQRAIGQALRPPTPNVSSSTANTSSTAQTPTPVEQTGPTADSIHLSSLPFPSHYPVELDIILPKVCEALVLVTQCIITIILEAEDQGRNQDEDSSTSSSSPANGMRHFFNQERFLNQGMTEHLIQLLRLLDQFLPRINFGRPSANKNTHTPTKESTVVDNGFNYLKRDLVRLLGILCYNMKTVQDRARGCGGIQVVMNLCVIDDRNPYLREHAIFTLRNLLKDNPENQAVVDGIKPNAEWDEDGVLREIPGAVNR